MKSYCLWWKPDDITGWYMFAVDSSLNYILGLRDFCRHGEIRITEINENSGELIKFE